MSKGAETQPIPRKMALVIGNGGYSGDSNKLKHPENNANDINTVLEEIGFDVKTYLNAEDIMDLITKFIADLQEDDVVFFYYSGHIFQFKGENFMVTTKDEKIKLDRHVPDYSASVLNALERFTQKLRSKSIIAIFDSYGSYKIEEVSHSTNTVSGFASIPETKDVLVHLATEFNHSVLLETVENERNSVYTKHLLRRLKTQGADIETILDLVTEDVMRETRRRQKPKMVNMIEGSKQLILFPTPPPSEYNLTIDDYNRLIRDLKFELEAYTLRGPHNGSIYNRKIRARIRRLRGRIHEFELKRNDLIMARYSKVPVQV